MKISSSIMQTLCVGIACLALSSQAAFAQQKNNTTTVVQKKNSKSKKTKKKSTIKKTKPAPHQQTIGQNDSKSDHVKDPCITCGRG